MTPAYPDYHRVAPTAGNGPGVSPTTASPACIASTSAPSPPRPPCRSVSRGGTWGRSKRTSSATSARATSSSSPVRLSSSSACDLVAYVRPARGNTNFTPIWGGTRSPISESLGEAMRETLGHAAVGDRTSPELAAASPIILAQLALEAGRPRRDPRRTLPHARGFAPLRVPVRRQAGACWAGGDPGTAPDPHQPLHVLIASNDYGFELLADRDYDFRPFLTPDLFSTSALFDDAVASVNLGELARGPSPEAGASPAWSSRPTPAP